MKLKEQGKEGQAYLLTSSPVLILLTTDLLQNKQASEKVIQMTVFKKNDVVSERKWM